MLPKDHELFLPGTESDGIKNEFYYSMCYKKGQFLYPEITTAKEMQEFVKNVLKKQGVGTLKRWFYTVSIPQLKRWK
tara:strand:+ start:1286 stop:1516 length:231 start_codon:yes stop_codon:yes gene_type:complete